MKNTPRRDRCMIAGKRASRLTYGEAALAWKLMAAELEVMGDMDMPKFKHLYSAIRKATIKARWP